MNTAIPRILSIAGSDSCGGAGIQADIKTATALGAYAMTAITAVTAQDTTGVRVVQLMSAELVRAQIIACLSDIGADAIKIGMLGSAAIALAVFDALHEQARGIPIVLDPILESTSGTQLLDEAGIQILREQLIPLAVLVTPNIPEAEALTGLSCTKPLDILRACEALLAMGAKGVLAKGGHQEGDLLADTLMTERATVVFERPRIDSSSTHGTGCTYATAIAVELANGLALEEAVRRAQAYVHGAIAAAPDFGSGHGPLNHMHSLR
ncbi:MAG TPA: bifunctional hydroxymethylpyrimidine kinase/phosphomethylpyrimidine kinase [Rhizomicrobium sp.]|nr:bifunctional hydroxymethylpyrimidine kinase/phosphomethylpyrimidine kinase [Rhizomicrobium sp.]